MRFEELSYREDGLAVSVPFHPRLTVVGPLGGRARAEWIKRALGVLHGTRPGDGTGLTFRDHAGRHVRLERDGHGAARITGAGTGDDFTPAAGELPLDGRLDWFASFGLDSAATRALVCLRPDDFKGDDVNPWEVEDELCDARAELARVEAEHATVMARGHEAEELRRRVLELDEWLIRLEEQRARRRHGEALEAVRRLEARRAVQLQTVAAERTTADAILAAAQAARDWRHAVAALEVAEYSFGDRSAARPPSEPAAAESPAASGGDDLHAELEAAHRAIEAAERALEHVRLPGLAVAARRRLARAQRREQAVLQRMGFGSWLAVEMQRVDLLREPATEPVGPIIDAGGHGAGQPAAASDAGPDARLRRTLAEADAAARASRSRLEAALAGAGLPSGGGEGDLEAKVAAVIARATEAAAHRRTPPTAAALEETEIELAAARSALAAFGNPDWDGDPGPNDEPLPDPEPLLAERARLFEEAYHLDRALPDVSPLEDQREAVARRIALLEQAAGLGYELMGVEESEMVLLDRVARAVQVGPAGEPVPLLVDDAFAGFEPEERLDLLHLLARLAEATQVVYLTGDPTTLEWAAAQAGAGDALVVPPPAVPPPAVASVA